MIDPILISISPNEKNTKDRIADIETAIQSFQGQYLRISADPKQPADLQLKWQNRYLHIEIKDTNNSNDLWGSKTGHIGDQLISLIDSGQPAFVVVCGSLDSTLGEVPTMTSQGGHTKWAGRDAQEGNKTSLRALCADFAGCNVPVFFLSKNRILSFKWALSYAKNILQGPDPFQWASTFKGRAGKIQALRMARGIGTKNATALLDHFGNLKRVGLAPYEELIEVPGIGRERAIAILDLFQ